MTEQHDDILQCDKDLGGEKEPGKALARSEALLPASVAGAFVVRFSDSHALGRASGLGNLTNAGDAFHGS